MSRHNMDKGVVKLAEVLDYGQANDTQALEVLKAFNEFRNGYYKLCGISDFSWWEWMNQGTSFDRIMESQWKKLDEIDFMCVMETMAIALAGTYVRFDEFVKGVEDSYNRGCGYRGIEEGESE